MICCDRFVTYSDAMVGRLVSPIKYMISCVSYVGLSVKTFYYSYELMSTLNNEFNGNLCLALSEY